MRVSPLQRFLLLRALDARGTVHRSVFRAFYTSRKPAPRAKEQENDITRSLERLIDRGLFSGYGKRTPRKWFLESVRLTPAGRRAARKLLGEQQRLPLPTVH